MATGSVVPVSEYLASVYRPDVDYIDGEIKQRNLGEQEHSDLQVRLILRLATVANQSIIRVNSEIRVQVGAERFRVPDIRVMPAGGPREPIVRVAPLLCIETLSPRDTIFGMPTRVRDLPDMGVLQVWLVDPATRAVILCSGTTTTEQTTEELTVPGTSITVTVGAIFSALD